MRQKLTILPLPLWWCTTCRTWHIVSWNITEKRRNRRVQVSFVHTWTGHPPGYLRFIQIGEKEVQESVVDNVRWQVLVFKPETDHDMRCTRQICPFKCDDLYFFLSCGKGSWYFRVFPHNLLTFCVGDEDLKQTYWGWVMQQITRQ